MLVDIILKDNQGHLLDCAIFITDEKGQESLHNKIQIAELLNGINIINDGWIFYQNKYTNGRVHYENIESYIIREIDIKDF